MNRARSESTRPPACEPKAQRLAALFVREPELIRACLECIENEPPETIDLILTAAQAAVATCPEYADLCYHSAQAAVCAGRYQAAAALLEGALCINPGYRDALVLAARVALLRGKPAEAKGFLHGALARGAEYPDVHMLIGDVLRGEGDWCAARAAYERALQLNGNLPAARQALAALPSAEARGKIHELPA